MAADARAQALPHRGWGGGRSALIRRLRESVAFYAQSRPVIEHWQSDWVSEARHQQGNQHESYQGQCPADLRCVCVERQPRWAVLPAMAASNLSQKQLQQV